METPPVIEETKPNEEDSVTQKNQPKRRQKIRAIMSRIYQSFVKDPVTTATVIIALGTVWLALLGQCSIQEQRRTLDSTLSRTDSALKISNLAILRQDTAVQRELRAYVGITAKRQRDDNGTMVIRVFAENYGKTPALNFNWWIDTVFDNYPLVGNLKSHKRSSERASSVLNPGQPFGESFEMTPQSLFKERVDKYRARKIRLYISGVAEYVDVFGGCDTTWFRFELPFVNEAVEQSDAGNYAK